MNKVSSTAPSGGRTASISFEGRILLPKLAAYAKSYQTKVLGDLANLTGAKPDRPALRGAIADSLFSARAFLGFYAFERAGAGQAGYREICADLLQPGAAWAGPDDFFRAFERECKKRRVGVNAKLNREVVNAGYRLHFENNPPSGWLHEKGRQIAVSGQVLPVYLELLSITGIGPKIAAFLCRDLVWLFECEGRLPLGEQVLLQPVDTWVRQIAWWLWPEFKRLGIKAPDMLLALRLSEAAQQAKCSGIELNQGMWWFGSHRREEGSRGDLGAALARMAS